VGLLLTGYRYFDRVARHFPTPLAVPMIEELTAAYGATALLFLVVLPYARKIRWLTASHAFTILAHTTGALAFSAAHTTLNWSLRKLVFAAAGHGSYNYGSMPTRYAMELPMDLIVYTLFVVATHAVWRYQETRQGELNAVHLEAQLLEAQLRNLRGQIEPHFLFNALNTISSVMYDNPAAADEMLGHLGDLFRASLSRANEQLVPLRSELELLEHYLALIRSRFGDRLTIDVNVASDALDWQVPPLLLQPLVENAVRHGGVERRGTGRITVRGALDRTWLSIEVSDDGPGVDPSVDIFAAGVGLSATRERLRLIYGYDDQMQVGNRPEGGFRVHLMLAPPPTVRGGSD
jgi:two-component system LytT family sensor kinase